MDVTDEEYQRAIKAIGMARQKPDAISAGTLETLVDLVKRYKAQGSSAKPAESTADLVPETGPETGPPTVAQQEARDRIAKEKETAAAEHPEITAALQASGLPYGIPLRQARASRYLQKVEDKNLPSASGIKDLYSPPEYTAPGSLGYGPDEGETSANPFTGNPMYERPPGIGSAKSGRTTVFYEPSIEAFRSKMEPILGKKVNDLDQTSREYKTFADREYQLAYKKAVDSDQSIVRAEYVPNDALRERLKNQKESNAIISSGLDAATAGLASRAIYDKETRQKIREQKGATSSALTLPAEIVGTAVNPLFVGLGPAAAGTPFLRAVGREGLGLGAGAAANRGIEIAAGDEKLSPADIAKQVGLAGAVGFGAGAIGGAIPQGARALNENLEKTTAVGALKQKGARTSFRHGIVPSPAMADAERQAAEAGFINPETRRPDVAAFKAAQLEEPMTATARAEQGAAARRTAEAQSEVYAEPANQRVISAKPLVDKLNQVRDDLLVNGKPRSPVAEQQIRVIDKWLERTQQKAGDFGPGGYRPGSVAGAPVEYTPKQIDDLIDDLQSYSPKSVADGTSPEKVPLPDYQAIKEAAHQMRDEVAGVAKEGAYVPEGLETTIQGANGQDKTLRNYSAFQHETSRDIATEERRRYMAGLPEGEVPERLRGSEAERLKGRVAGYGKGGESDQAIEHYAGPQIGPFGASHLEAIRSANELESLRKRMGVDFRLRMYGPMPMPVTSATGTGARLRLDPALQFLARRRNPGILVPPLTPRPRRQGEEPNQLTIEQISAMLAASPQQ